MKKIKVVIGSTNPVKIECVRSAFFRYFKNMEAIGTDVESGVPNQPKSDRKTLEGALIRATQSLLKDNQADFGVGIEGGLERIKSNLYAFAWICVKSRRGKISLGRTASFLLPPKIEELIKSGRELGEATDVFFDVKNSKQKTGTIGLLSKGKLDRKKLYEQGVLCALLPFLNKELY